VKSYETYTDTAGEHRWRLTDSNSQIVGASSEGFSSEHECNKNAWRVVSGLTECLGVTQGSAEAPEWLYDALAKMRQSPEQWARLQGLMREMLDVLETLEGLPPELAGNVSRLIEDVVGPEPA